MVAWSEGCRSSEAGVHYLEPASHHGGRRHGLSGTAVMRWRCSRGWSVPQPAEIAGMWGSLSLPTGPGATSQLQRVDSIY